MSDLDHAIRALREGRPLDRGQLELIRNAERLREQQRERERAEQARALARAQEAAARAKAARDAAVRAERARAARESYEQEVRSILPIEVAAVLLLGQPEPLDLTLDAPAPELSAETTRAGREARARALEPRGMERER
ncbi:hypothetical protein D5S18_29525 [Nocardia panacis]|uniref:Uncharacterized protein n=1 Tax=Nocardia panacis TaxID=2340916 RepID=A0A3A4JZE7_9NOCA|nr:hypothetical protein [Nocardia panacis]RJO70006.1 hypothetical protein D5S18_29525 [Nocardia panacis]